MTARVLGLVALGQTPRPDFVSAFREHASRAEIRIAGALDGVPKAEVDRLAADDSEYPLHTRLADGTILDIPLKRLFPFVEARVRQVAAGGAHLVVVLCAGGFPDIGCAVPVLLPGRVLPAVVGTITRTRHIGVVVPNAGQVPAAADKWRADGFQAKVTSASPFRHQEIAAAADALADPALELVVLDCMGHQNEYRREFARRIGRPVILTQTLVARIAGELMSAGG